MTRFVYPSAVSNASYAMTWDQLRELQATGLFDVQSHTYWHPNFKKEREKLPPAEFDKLVHMQLANPGKSWKRSWAGRSTCWPGPSASSTPISWTGPRAAGYAAAFTIERHPVTRRDHPMALPRYLLADTDRGKIFAAILNAPIAIAKKGEDGMRKRIRKLLWTAALVFIFPLAGLAESGHLLTVVDHHTGQAIAGAVVTLDGEMLNPDPQGLFALDEGERNGQGKSPRLPACRAIAARSAARRAAGGQAEPLHAQGAVPVLLRRRFESPARTGHEADRGNRAQRGGHRRQG